MKHHILLNGQVRTIKPDADVEQTIAKLKAKGYTCEKCKPQPSIKTLEKWVYGGECKATDGCRCDPDGSCPHGAKSWLLVLGMI